jgi:hypothetical protein
MKKVCIGAVLLLAVGLVLFESCKKETNISLKGNVWIESKNRADTLVFQDDNTLLLQRPRVQTGSYILPKIGAGPYTYKELKDSIQLHYSLSSLYAPKNYAYRIEGKKLFIDDFYEKTSTTIVFEKLR